MDYKRIKHLIHYNNFIFFTMHFYLEIFSFFKGNNHFLIFLHEVHFLLIRSKKKFLLLNKRIEVSFNQPGDLIGDNVFNAVLCSFCLVLQVYQHFFRRPIQTPNYFAWSI